MFYSADLHNQQRHEPRVREWKTNMPKVKCQALNPSTGLDDDDDDDVCRNWPCLSNGDPQLKREGTWTLQLALTEEPGSVCKSLNLPVRIPDSTGASVFSSMITISVEPNIDTHRITSIRSISVVLPREHIPFSIAIGGFPPCLNLNSIAPMTTSTHAC